ncbi:hypothetical protein D3C73_1302650 [compost metagenome]
MHAIQVTQARVGIHVDMAADASGAFAQEGQRQRARMASRVMVCAGAPGAFVFNAVGQGGANRIHIPR